MIRVILLSVLVTVMCQDKLFTPCKSNDSQCMIREATKAKNLLLDGYKPFNLPKYNPFTIPSVLLEGNGLSLKFEPMILNGYKPMEFQEIKMDVQKRTLYFKAFVKDGFMSGKYQLKGKFGSRDIDGQGDAKILCDNTTFKFNGNFDLVEKKGKKYAKLTKSQTEFRVTKVKFEFEDVVKGNKEASKATNDALTTGWEKVTEALGPSIEKMMDGPFALAIGKLFDNVPFDQLVIP